jgi:hypothetical protein
MGVSPDRLLDDLADLSVRVLDFKADVPCRIFEPLYMLLQMKGALVVCDQKVEYPETSQNNDVFDADKRLVIADELPVDVVSVHVVSKYLDFCKITSIPNSLIQLHIRLH